MGKKKKSFATVVYPQKNQIDLLDYVLGKEIWRNKKKIQGLFEENIK